MRLAILAASAALVTAGIALLPGAAADSPSCTPTLDGDGTVGAGCRLADTCYSIVWGYHSGFLTVGGGSSCSGGVWVNPNESPEDPPVGGLDLLCTATSGVC